MEKIEIGYNPIATTLGVSNHKFIIYSRTDGSSFQIHGGGSNDAGFSPLDEIASSISPSNVGNSDFGFLTVTIIKTPANKKVADDLKREMVFADQDLSETFFKMAGMAQGIAEQKSPYNFLANNSNTLVDRIVKWSGGSAPSSDGGINAPGSLPDSEFNPALFGKLPPPIWGKDLYTRHSDVMSDFIENGLLRDITSATADAGAASINTPDQRKRNRGDLQGIVSPEHRGVDGFAPGRGDLFEPMPEKPAGPDSEQGILDEMFPDKQAARPAEFATEDADDFYRMAEEVFSSLTIDDWAIIHDDNDPYDNRDPFADGVKWVPGLGTLPANP